jgi:hypothetical protein
MTTGVAYPFDQPLPLSTMYLFAGTQQAAQHVAFRLFEKFGAAAPRPPTAGPTKRSDPLVRKGPYDPTHNRTEYDSVRGHYSEPMHTLSESWILMVKNLRGSGFANTNQLTIFFIDVSRGRVDVDTTSSNAVSRPWCKVYR